MESRGADSVSESKDESERITFSASDMPLGDFVRWVSDATGVSIIVEQGLDAVPVSVEVTDQPVEVVLSTVARRAGVEVNRSGNLYFLGALKKNDIGVLVRRVRRLNQADIRQAVQVLLTENGQIAAFEDGLCVIGDRVETLSKINDLISDVEDAENSTWVVQLYLVSLSGRDASDFGFDLNPALDIAVTFAGASTDVAGAFRGVDTGASLNASFQSILRASRERSTVSVVSQPMFYLADGSSSKFTRGDRLPIERTNFDDQKNAQSTDTEFVQAGTNIEAELREVSAGAAMLDLDISLSQAVGEMVTGRASPTPQETYQTKGVIRSGGIYLVGAMPRNGSEVGQGSGLQSSDVVAVENRILMIWARAYRIDQGEISRGRKRKKNESITVRPAPKKTVPKKADPVLAPLEKIPGEIVLEAPANAGWKSKKLLEPIYREEK